MYVGTRMSNRNYGLILLDARVFCLPSALILALGWDRLKDGCVTLGVWRRIKFGSCYTRITKAMVLIKIEGGFQRCLRYWSGFSSSNFPREPTS